MSDGSAKSGMAWMQKNGPTVIDALISRLRRAALHADDGTLLDDAADALEALNTAVNRNSGDLRGTVQDSADKDRW